MQHNVGNFTSALHSRQRALGVRRKLFGEEHASTANSYHELGTTQCQLSEFTLALQSHQRGLDIRLNLSTGTYLHER